MVLLVLSIIAAGVFYVLLRLGALWLLALLATCIAVLFSGVVNYVLWGRSSWPRSLKDLPDDANDGRSRRRRARWQDLPPAIRQRLMRDLNAPTEDPDPREEPHGWD